MPDEISRDGLRAGWLARRILRAAVVGDGALSARLLRQLANEYGADGIATAMLLWVDVVIHNVGGYVTTNEILALQFHHPDTGEAVTTEDMPRESVWAGQVLTARMRHDQAQYEALMSVIPTDDQRATGRYVGALLTMCAATIADHLKKARCGPGGVYLPDPPPGHTWN
jgi:hypothetical protein